ncbi:MAG: efflux RND transporter permease subunit [Rudaea sp.]|nr:efflux RND transporter permease subunit [Rudaea sp.]
MNIVEAATRRRVTVGMVTLTFVLFGLIALSGLKVNLLPDLSYPTITVRTEYEGAAPLEMENLISQPVEEAIGVVKNLRKIHSVSRAGQSDVILEFAWGTNMDQASLDVRDKLDVLQLPLEAKKPVLLRFNPSTDPIMRLSLTAASAQGAGEVNEAELKQLRRFADDELKKRLEPTPGVAAVKVGGGLEDQVDVDIDQHKLQQLNLNVADVVKRLSDENVNVSGGRIENGSQRYLVRTVNQFGNLDEMRGLLIKVDKGVPVRLADIADVRQGFKEREGIVRVDGREAIELAVYKEGDANTVSVAAGVKRQLDRLTCVKQAQSCISILPTSAKLDTIDDQSIFIQSSLDDVRNDAIIGGILAIIIIFFFLNDVRSTMIIALSLPISLIATFFFMGQAGVSLNVMSLGGLALATGMVVDDSIVVLENIARLREQGMGIFEAAVKGAREVSMAVIASTLTTVAVFFPLVFVQGVAGQLFRDEALTVTFAMMISLVVAMTLIPMLASRSGKSPIAYKDEKPSAGWQPTSRFGKLCKKIITPVSRLFFYWIPFVLAYVLIRMRMLVRWLIFTPLGFVGRYAMMPYNAAARAYHAFLPKALTHPFLVLGFAALAFIASVLVIPSLGMDLIPSLAQGRFEMNVKMPPGTALVDTDALVRELQQKNAKDPNIKLIYGVSGTGTRLDANPTDSGENVARMLIVLNSGVGEQGEREATEALRANVAAHPGTEVKFARPALFSFATPLEIELRGYDLASLEKAGKKLSSLMNASPRFADVKSTVEAGYPEIQIHFDQDRAAALGLTTKQIADQVVNKVRGSVATRYSFRDRKIDVLVRAQADQRGSVDDIRNLIVGYVQNNASGTSGSTTAASGSSSDSGSSPTGSASNTSGTGTTSNASGTMIRLSAVADVVATQGPSEIHRIGQERVAIVSANLHYGDLGSAVTEVQKLIHDNPLAAGVTTHIGGQSEELDASVRSLIFALALAIFLVYLVMASQFESLLHPFVIMFSIPLALVGAVLALKLTFTPLSIVVFIGLIMLAGIVVKNAIVLIDRVNQLREEGVEKIAAIVQAAESRLRPIMMTTLCTLLGFMPLAIGIGDGNEVRAPMAITVIGGLLVSTLLTLVVIPVVYTLLDRRSDAVYRERGKRKHQAVADDAQLAAEGAMS